MEAKWEDRNQLLKSFEDGGFLYNNACGIIETDEEVTFFLGEGEKVDSLAVRYMDDWGFDNDLEFIGIHYEDEEENIPVDDWYDENQGTIKECLKAVFKKQPWFGKGF